MCACFVGCVARATPTAICKLHPTQTSISLSSIFFSQVFQLAMTPPFTVSFFSFFSDHLPPHSQFFKIFTIFVFSFLNWLIQSYQYLNVREEKNLGLYQLTHIWSLFFVLTSFFSMWSSGSETALWICLRFFQFFSIEWIDVLHCEIFWIFLVMDWNGV